MWVHLVWLASVGEASVRDASWARGLEWAQSRKASAWTRPMNVVRDMGVVDKRHSSIWEGWQVEKASEGRRMARCKKEG